MPKVAAIIRHLVGFSLLIALTLAVFCRVSRAEDQVVEPAQRNFGIGLIVGHPTGLSGKGYLTPDTAIDGAIGFGDTTRQIHMHADYLWHFVVQRWDATNLQ